MGVIAPRPVRTVAGRRAQLITRNCPSPPSAEAWPSSVTAGHQLVRRPGRALPAWNPIYRLDGKVLLLGCGHDSNTSLHLAELAAAVAAARELHRRVRPAARRHKPVIDQLDEDVVVNADDFEQIGAAFEVAEGLSIGQVGDAEARLTPQRALVDFARPTWIAAHRPAA